MTDGREEWRRNSTSVEKSVVVVMMILQIISNKCEISPQLITSADCGEYGYLTD
jgi:hypothetical protein